MLSVNKVRSLSRPGRYYDGKGLVLQLTGRGRGSWFYRYWRFGRERWMGLGGLDLVSLEEARHLAHTARRQLRSGSDPIEARRAARQEAVAATTTFAEAARDYHAAHKVEWRGEKHIRQWLQVLEDHVFPRIGRMPVAKIDTAAVLGVLKPLPTHSLRSKVRQKIEATLDRASATGLRSGDNPARWSGHIEELLPAPRTRDANHHAAMPWRDVPEFMGSLRALQDPIAIDAAALEFLVLTAARSGEVINAVWSEIVDDVWTIPANRMKAGREHRVPLSDRAQEIIDLMRSLRESEFVFPGTVKGAPLYNQMMPRLMKRLGAKYTIHGFRSSFRDWAGEHTAFPREVCEQALAHTIGAVERAYRRGDLFAKRRQLMAAWAKYCAQPSAAGEVVQIRSAS
jgi:integrase